MSTRFRLAGLNAFLAVMIAFAGFAGMVRTTSAQATGSISTLAKDAETGATLVGATICLDGAENCQTPVEGEAAYFQNIEYGPHTLSASIEGYEPNSVEITLEQPHLAQNVELTAVEEPPIQQGSISSLAKDAETGATLVGATICLDGAENCQTPVEGEAAYFQNIEYGPHTLSASIEGYEPNSVEITLEQPHLAQNVELTAVEEPPVEEAGTVAISVFLCAGQDELLWNEEPGPDCGYDAGNFIFYPVDGDEGDFEDIFVDGQGSIDLPAGDYEVFQEFFPDTSTIISVTAGETTELTVLNPGTSEPETYPVMFTATTPDEGSAEGALVYVASDDGVQTFFQVAPEPNGTLNADNSFSMQLPAGDYLVTIDAIDQGYNVATVPFTVPGTGDVVTIALETAPVLPDEGYVHIHHYTCEGLDEVIFDGTLDQVHEGCTPTPATLTFYLYGDGTDDHWQVTTDESGVTGIELLVGEYEVVHEATQAKADVTVLAGAVTELVVLSPEQAETPDEGDTGEEGKTPEEKDKGKKKSAVSELPKTGSGQQTSTTHMAAMLVAAAAVSAAAGGVALRQKRS